MLRSAFLQTESIPSIYFSLTPTTQQTFKADVLTAIQERLSKNLFKKMCDLIAVMGSAILAPGLLPFVNHITEYEHIQWLRSRWLMA